MGLGIKTYLLFKLGEITGRHPPKFEGHYTVWRALRIQAILEHYGPRFFIGKSILEFGAGYGAIGAAFSLIGGDVTCVEGRAANVATIKKRYPFLSAQQGDLNADLLGLKPRSGGKWDLIIHMGVLYHLRDPEHSLRQTCRMTDHLVLETECSDSDDPAFVPLTKEKTYWSDQALDGVGSQPSPAFVERVLKEEGMEFERITDARCNSDPDVYDWPVRNTKTFVPGRRRMWFVKRPAAGAAHV
jgi:SAM-dependent methyltransferase